MEVCLLCTNAPLDITCNIGNLTSLQQRGKLKEEEFMKKLRDMMTEEERQRIPTAQGLPWTTDEPEVSPFLGAIVLQFQYHRKTKHVQFFFFFHDSFNL